MGKHGFENFSIDEMRQMLTNEFPDYVTKENLNLTKVPLANLLNELRKSAQEPVPDNLLANLEIEVEDDYSMETLSVPLDEEVNTKEDQEKLRNMVIELDEPIIEDNIKNQYRDIIVPPNKFYKQIEPEKPKFGSPEWSDYVKSLLLPDEIYNDQPKCDGLKRLVELLIGPIIQKQLKCIKAPSVHDNTATIAVSIMCEAKELKTHLIEESIADANESNNHNEPYCYHMSATAETKAEARCYRKLLRLKNVIAAEEGMSSTDMIPVNNSNNKITSIQIEGIDRLANRLNLNVMDFVNVGSSGKKYENVNDIEFDTALKMIEFMNAISSGKAKPEGVGEYNPNWRK